MSNATSCGTDLAIASAPASTPTIAKQNPMLEAALGYASRGWRVFPLLPGEKTPATRHGLKDATSDTTIIEGWFRSNPRYNIGVNCGSSGLFTVDLDVKDGIDGIKKWQELSAEKGFPAGNTLTSITPSGGQHHIYEMPLDRLNNSANKAGPGIDGRGDGGYIAAPPSVIADKQYRWENVGVVLQPMPLAAARLFAKKPVEKKPVSPARAVVTVGGTTSDSLIELIRADGFALTHRSTNLGEGPCPWCGGTDRFIVACGGEVGRDGTDHYFYCRQCGRNGDSVEWLIQRREMNPAAAKKARGAPYDAKYIPVEARFSSCTAVGELKTPSIPTATPLEISVSQTPSWTKYRTSGAVFTSTKPAIPEFLVDRTLEKGVFGIVIGQPGGLKTMMILDMVLCVAAGIPWLEPESRDDGVAPRRTTKGRVAWIDVDNGKRRTHERVNALATGHSIAADNIGFYTFPPLDLTKPESVMELRNLIRFEDAQLVVIDTLVNSMSVKNENDNAEIRGPMQALRQLVEETGCTILVIHHPNKSSGGAATLNSIRGGGALAGAVDLAVVVTRDNPQGDMVTVTAVKDRGAPFTPVTARWAFKQDLVGRLETGRFYGVPAVDVGGGQDIDMMSLILVELEGGGLNTNNLCAALRGRKERKIAAIKSLEKRGAIHRNTSTKCYEIVAKIEEL